MCCCSCPLQQICDVALLKAAIFGEELETIPVVRQVRCCDDDAAVILVAWHTADSLNSASCVTAAVA